MNIEIFENGCILNEINLTGVDLIEKNKIFKSEVIKAQEKSPIVYSMGVKFIDRNNTELIFLNIHEKNDENIVLISGFMDSVLSDIVDRLDQTRVSINCCDTVSEFWKEIKMLFKVTPLTLEEIDNLIRQDLNLQ